MKRIESTQPGDLEAWVSAAIQAVYCREATSQEIQESIAFIQEHADMIENEFDREFNAIASSVRDYYTEELDETERLDTAALLQETIVEILSSDSEKNPTPKTLALVGGEGGPHLKEIEDISGRG